MVWDRLAGNSLGMLQGLWIGGSIVRCFGYVCTIWVRVDFGGLGVVGFGIDKKY